MSKQVKEILHRGPMKPSLVLLASVIASATSGCATIGYTEPTTSEAPIRQWRQEVPTKGALGSVEQDGTTISISATQACDVREDRTIKRTSTSEAMNQSAALDWLIAGLGVVGAGTGTFLMIDAGSTYPADKTSRMYNPVGPGNERLYGVGFIAAGAALLAIPVIDVIRAGETKVETQEMTLQGEPSQRGIACSNRPLAEAAITGDVGGSSFALGTTSPQGKLTVDLDQAIDRDVVLRSSTGMTVVAGDNTLGTITLDPVRRVREERLWKSVEVKRCQEATQLDACGTVERFLASYPDGAHAAEAKELMDGAKPKLLALEDDQRWGSINVTACTKREYETSAEVRTACEPLGAYLAAFPLGRHAKEASAAAQRGRERADAVDKAIERRQKAEEQKEAQQGKKRCVGLCKIMCSQWQYSRNPETCFSGCTARCE